MWERLRLLFNKSPSISVIVYTRSHCPLCDEACELLEKFTRSHRLKIETIDIESDPTLMKAHGERIPVIVINGTERFFGKINESLLKRQLDAERRPRPV